MAAVTVRTPTLAGVNPSPAAASAGGDTVANPRGNVLIRVNNGSVGAVDVTLAVGPNATRPADGTYPAHTYENIVVSVPAGESRVIGPVPPAYNNASGQVAVTYEDTTSVTVEAIQP